MTCGSGGGFRPRLCQHSKNARSREQEAPARGARAVSVQSVSSHAERFATGAPPFSEAERARVCNALKAELARVFKGGSTLSEPEQLANLNPKSRGQPSIPAIFDSQYAPVTATDAPAISAVQLQPEQGTVANPPVRAAITAVVRHADKAVTILIQHYSEIGFCAVPVGARRGINSTEGV
ncbi:MAG: hypothetical protein JWO52_7964 [Gammaproteobacteria bacterium]|jgi:hypothetical protein|nr:hypothetical protein [Gammaproteobacteria bacterium]